MVAGFFPGRAAATRAIYNWQPEGAPRRESYAQYLKLSHELLQVERQTALQLRQEGRIEDEVLRELQHELELSETRLNASIEHSVRG